MGSNGACADAILPSPAINIDTSVNAAFMADKLNTAKSYVDITDC
jgi:hypothetical protein